MSFSIIQGSRGGTSATSGGGSAGGGGSGGGASGAREPQRIRIFMDGPPSASWTVRFRSRRSEKRLQLHVGALLKIGLQAFQVIKTGIGVGARALFFKTAREQQRRRRIVGIEIEKRAERFRGSAEIALLPERVAEVEAVGGIIRVAVECPAKIVHRGLLQA